MQGRGERTQARLLEAATRMFSERGFEGVSTREIASAAGTTLPSIAHHFGSKQGLYEAVFRGITEEMRRQVGPAAMVVAARLAGPEMSRSEALETLEMLLDALARAILSSPADLTALIVREQLGEGMALRDQPYERHLIAPVARLIGRLRGLPAESDAVKLQALMLAGRVLAFRALRRSSLGLMGWPSLTEVEVEVIVGALRDEVRAIFG